MHVLRSEALIRAHWLPDQSKTSCDQEPLWELIDSLIANKLVVIEGSYQSLLTPRLIRISLRLRARIRAQWLKNSSTTFLRSGAFTRAHWLFEEVTGEVTDTQIDSQASCDWEILLERIVSLVHQRILAIRRSYQSLLTPWSTVVIRSSYQSSLTPRSKNISSCYWKLI